MTDPIESTIPNVLAIAHILVSGAAADIFYDADQHGDTSAQETIDDVQLAMNDAAAALPKMVVALRAMWEFGSVMVEKHGANGDNTMAADDHARWQDVAGEVASLLSEMERPIVAEQSLVEVAAPAL